MNDRKILAAALLLALAALAVSEWRRLELLAGDFRALMMLREESPPGIDARGVLARANEITREAAERGD